MRRMPPLESRAQHEAIAFPLQRTRRNTIRCYFHERSAYAIICR